LFCDGKWFLLKSGRVKLHIADVSLFTIKRFLESGDRFAVMGTDWLLCAGSRGKTSNRVFLRRQNLKTMDSSVMTKMFRFGGDLGFRIGLESEIFWDLIVIRSCSLAGFGRFLRE
jgi:hypothetical protein